MTNRQLIAAGAVLVPLAEVLTAYFTIETIYRQMNRDHEAQMIGGLTAIFACGMLAAVLTVALFAFWFLKVLGHSTTDQ